MQISSFGLATVSSVFFIDLAFGERLQKRSRNLTPSHPSRFVGKRAAGSWSLIRHERQVELKKKKKKLKQE